VAGVRIPTETPITSIFSWLCLVTLKRNYKTIAPQFRPQSSTFKVQSYLTIDSQSVLVSGHNQGPWPIFFLLEIFLRQLRISYLMAPSLTRERVCNLLLLLDLSSAVPLASESRGTKDHILLFQPLRLPSTWRARSPYLYPPGTGWPSYATVKHSRFYMSQSNGWMNSEQAPTYITYITQAAVVFHALYNSSFVNHFTTRWYTTELKRASLNKQ
jgi:hypothetical protein